MSFNGGKRIFGFSIPSGVINNLFSMYGIYCSTYLLAVVTVPYLSRTLGPAAWGLLAAIQSFAGCLLLAVEFGFTYSGIKEAARTAGEPEVFTGSCIGGTGRQTPPGAPELRRCSDRRTEFASVSRARRRVLVGVSHMGCAARREPCCGSFRESSACV